MKNLGFEAELPWVQIPTQLPALRPQQVLFPAEPLSPIREGMNTGQASKHGGGFRASGTAAGHSQELSKSWGRGTAIKQEAPPTWGSERRPSPAQVVIQTLTRPRTASGPAPPFPHLGEDPPDKAQRHPHSTRQGLPLANPRPSQPPGQARGQGCGDTDLGSRERTWLALPSAQSTWYSWAWAHSLPNRGPPACTQG